MSLLSATYDPTDNKLRLYAVHRLDTETFERVKAAGFKWAPKQQLFVAPMWTPAREDLLLELCEEIDDEDKTLVDRAEERAERFDEYSESREKECETKRGSVQRLAEVMNGQPVLVGHHSEKRHRKDLQRMSDNMRASHRLWETARYWERRAQGAIRHAKYKELAPVRARRIKGLEADQRKYRRELEESEKFLKLWTLVQTCEPERALRDAIALANADPMGDYSAYRRLESGELLPQDAAAAAIVKRQARVKLCERWIKHFQLRLTYERALLDASGFVPPAKVKSAKQTLPLLNYRADVIEVLSQYRTESMVLGQVEMTSAEWKKKHKDFKGSHIVADKSHKVRTCMVRSEQFVVFITDSKEHKKP